MDGTLIEAWASHKSFRPKDGSGDDDVESAPPQSVGGAAVCQVHEQTSQPSGG